MAKDIWAGVNFGDSIINPWSVAQTYTPATGQTTYGTGGANATAFKALESSSNAQAAKWVVAPAVATPTTTPVGAPVYQGANLGFLASSQATNFTPNTMTGGANLSPYASNPSAYKPELMKPIDYKPEVSANEVLAPKISNDEVNKWINQDADKRNLLMQEVMAAKPTDLASNDFINKAAQAALGRPAKDEINAASKYSMLGKTNKQVLDAFKLTASKIGATGLPSDSVVKDSTGADVTTDNEGVPDVSQSPAWKTEMESLIKQIETLSAPSAEETALADKAAQAKGSAQLGSLNVGEQLGEAMPLIQGEQQYLIDKANIQLQTMADRLGIMQSARQSKLTAVQNTADLKMKLQERVDAEKKMIYDQMQTKSENAQKNLALLLQTYTNAGGMDTSKMTADQKLQLTNLSKAAGLDSGIVMASIDALYNGKILETVGKNQLTSVQKQQMVANIATNLMASGYSSAEAIKQATATVAGITGGSGVITGTPTPTTPTGSGEGGMRTDRHNNPTAMTTDVAKTLGLIEGKDYIKGDPFQAGNTTLYTANLLGDGVQTTVKALDLAANDPKKQAFYTTGGAQRWNHTALTDETWKSLTPEQKKNTVLQMYQKEGGNGLFGTATGDTPTPTPTESKYSELVITAGENANKLGTLEGVDSKLLPVVQQYMAEKGYNIPSNVKPPTETEKITSVYVDRLKEADAIFNKFAAENKNPKSGFWGGVQSMLPDWGITNWLKSDDYQSYSQAERNFVNAVLRKESGAAISPTEFDSAAKQYFPQAGDSATVIAQKAANRKTTIEWLERASGSAIKVSPNDFGKVLNSNKWITPSGNSFTIQEVK